MSNTLGNTAKLSYPDYCTYCATKYYSSRCLLPYALASSITLPEDVTLQTMELTELHCSFSIDLFRHSADRVNYHSSTSDLQSQTGFGPTHNWVVSNDDLPPTSLLSPTQSTNDSGAPLTSQTARLDEAPTFGTAPTPENVESLETKAAPVEHSAKPDKRTATNVATSSHLTKANLEQYTTVRKRKAPVPSLSLTDTLHLVSDSVLAVATAQNLRKARRTNMTLEDLRISADKELTTKETLGAKYQPYHSTKLDHPIAFVRELVANHTDSDLHHWRTGKLKESDMSHHCYLTFSRSNPFIVSQPQNKRLDNYLVLFAKASLDVLLSQKEHKDQATTAYKYMLSTRKMDSTFEWLKTSPLEKLYLNDEALLTSEQANAPEKPSTSKANTLPTSESFPPLSEKTQKLLNSELPRALADSAQEFNTLRKSLPPGKINRSDYTRLVDLLLRLYPTWDKTTFVVKPPMIDQLATRLALTTGSLENLILSASITLLLKHLRDSQGTQD
jgi:hypothetical protein